jgi:hypothetical protein
MITKKDWKLKSIPSAKEDLGFSGFFADSDAETILSGHKPTDMDDKWFIYSDDGWVYFVRSWTGHYIYAIQLAGSPAGGARVISSWVNADQGQYKSPGRESDIQIINNLIKSRFGIACCA